VTDFCSFIIEDDVLMQEQLSLILCIRGSTKRGGLAQQLGNGHLSSLIHVKHFCSSGNSKDDSSDNNSNSKINAGLRSSRTC